MDGKRLLTGAVVGGIAMFALGWLVFELAFGSFYDAGSNLPAGVARDTRILWAWAGGSVALAVLVTGIDPVRWTPNLLREKGVHDAKNETGVSVGVSATDGAVSQSGTNTRRAE